MRQPRGLSYTVHQPGLGYTVHQRGLGKLRRNRALGQGLVPAGVGGAAMVGLLVLGVSLWAAWFLITKPTAARA